MSDEANDHGSLLKQVLTDKGQEFLNKAMAQWYQKRGIVHTRVGPKASQLNLVERTHQALHRHGGKNDVPVWFAEIVLGACFRNICLHQESSLLQRCWTHPV